MSLTQCAASYAMVYPACRMDASTETLLERRGCPAPSVSITVTERRTYRLSVLGLKHCTHLRRKARADGRTDRTEVARREADPPGGWGSFSGRRYWPVWFPWGHGHCLRRPSRSHSSTVPTSASLLSQHGAIFQHDTFVTHLQDIMRDPSIPATKSKSFCSDSEGPMLQPG
jgi:hypothetical protein